MGRGGTGNHKRKTTRKVGDKERKRVGVKWAVCGWGVFPAAFLIYLHFSVFFLILNRL